MSFVRPATKYKKKEQRYAEVVALQRQRAMQQPAAAQFKVRSAKQTIPNEGERERQRNFKEELGREKPAESVRVSGFFLRKFDVSVQVFHASGSFSLQFPERNNFGRISRDCVEVESVFACRWFGKWNCFPRERFRHAERSMSTCCHSERFQRAERFPQMSACCHSERF